MFAAPILIDRSITNFSAGVSGNDNRIKYKMAAKYRDKRTSITTVRDQYLSYATFPTPLIFHYPLPLRRVLKYLFIRMKCASRIVRNLSNRTGNLPNLPREENPGNTVRIGQSQ